MYIPDIRPIQRVKIHIEEKMDTWKREWIQEVYINQVAWGNGKRTGRK